MTMYRVTVEERTTRYVPDGQSDTPARIPELVKVSEETVEVSNDDRGLLAAAIELIRAEDTARVTASVGLYTTPDHNRVAEARIRYDRLYRQQNRRHSAHLRMGR